VIRRALGTAGVLMMGYAVIGALFDPDARRPGHLLFLAGVVFGHDLVLLPAALLVGALAARRAPPGIRGPVRGGLFASAVVTLVALPFVLGYGRPADDPSALPRDYGRGLAIALGAIWLGTGLVLAWRLIYRSDIGRRPSGEYDAGTPSIGRPDLSGRQDSCL
jgi:hypothetical protein